MAEEKNEWKSIYKIGGKPETAQEAFTILHENRLAGFFPTGAGYSLVGKMTFPKEG